LWKEDIGKVSGNFQCFTFLSNLLENISMKLPSNLRSIFLQPLVKALVKIFLSTFQGIYQAMNGFAILSSNLLHRDRPLLNKKNNYIDLTCDQSMKTKFNSRNQTHYWNFIE